VPRTEITKIISDRTESHAEGVNAFDADDIRTYYASVNARDGREKPS